MPEKTIKISGREVTFKATGGVMYRYKEQFGREMLADAATVQEFLETAKTRRVTRKDPKTGKIVLAHGKPVVDEVTEYDYTKLSLEAMYNLLWVYAKTADPSIPDPQTWLDSFDTFPVVDIYNQLGELTGDNLKVDAKNG